MKFVLLLISFIPVFCFSQNDEKIFSISGNVVFQDSILSDFKVNVSKVNSTDKTIEKSFKSSFLK